ncbi:hypothetical protein CHUAL_001027 [Chamberlinius hualienensis]
MSWQEYIDKQLMASKVIKHALIGGRDGRIWAKSDTFNPSQDEIYKLAQGFSNSNSLQMSGITLDGERYIYLSGDEKILRAKKGKVGLHCMLTNQAVVLGLYEDPIQPQQCATVVERLGEYLERCGY